MKEASRKAWKKVYFFLRRSGLYCSTKGSSKVRSSCRPDVAPRKPITALTLRNLRSVCVCARMCFCLCSWGGWDQEPRHLQYMADLEDLNAYSVVNSRKLYGAPTDFTFCIKVAPAARARGYLFRDQTINTKTVCVCVRSLPRTQFALKT